MKKAAFLLIDHVEADMLEETRRLAEEALKMEVYSIGSARCDVAPDAVRGQMRADWVVERCASRYRSQDRYVVAILGRDLYVPRLNFVFGLAEPNVGCAAVSWRRLQGPRDVFIQRLAKEVVHEVGHLRGLSHCTDSGCVMWFSNTLAETDRKGLAFCSRCAERSQP